MVHDHDPRVHRHGRGPPDLGQHARRAKHVQELEHRGDRREIGRRNRRHVGEQRGGGGARRALRPRLAQQRLEACQQVLNHRRHRKRRAVAVAVSDGPLRALERRGRKLFLAEVVQPAVAVGLGRRGLRAVNQHHCLGLVGERFQVVQQLLPPPRQGHHPRALEERQPLQLGQLRSGGGLDGDLGSTCGARAAAAPEKLSALFPSQQPCVPAFTRHFGGGRVQHARPNLGHETAKKIHLRRVLLRTDPAVAAVAAAAAAAAD